MSRAEAYGAFYRESRARLLQQVYAYTGNTEVARRALADAYITAAHHWRKLSANPDKDAWMRERAFRAAGRATNRSRRPWYVSARSTADEHRAFLRVMAALEPEDRKLVILRYLAGLDLPHAGREVGVTDNAARTSLEASAAKFAQNGVKASPADLAAGLERLRLDLHEEPVDTTSRLRREGNRRRRSHLLLAGITSLALAIGAGAVTAAQTPAATPGAPAEPVPAEPTAPALDPFSVAALAPANKVSGLDTSRPWTISATSADFGDVAPVHPCLTTVPTEKRADHYWVRDFTSGLGSSPNEAVQALEVAPTPVAAKATYSRLVQSLGSCRTGARQVVDFKVVQGLGDGASLFAYRFVDGGAVQQEQVAVIRSGAAVVTWIVRDSETHPVRPQLLVKVAGESVDAVCHAAAGSCSTPPYRAIERPPPPADQASGFLAAIDLPVFAGLAKPWVATSPRAVHDNPSATECDRADFANAGATRVRSRSFVVPDAPHLPPIFGMSETMGTFSSLAPAQRFMAKVAKTVASCEDRQLSLTVRRSDDLNTDGAHAHVWEIELAASEKKSFIFRVALLRVGTTVAQVTFTPSGDFDLDYADYVTLTERAAQRLTQL